MPRQERLAGALLWAAPAMLALAVLASVLAWPHLPERMPVHWGFDGEPTSLAPRGFAVSILPGVMLWIGFLMAALAWSARQTRGGGDLPAWVSPAVTATVLLLLLLLHIAMLGLALGYPVRMPFVVNVGVGVLLIVMGWMMPKVPQNAFFGVRTPTTLECPDAWRAANRVGGRAMVAAGVLTLAASPLPGEWGLAVMLVSVMGATAVSVVVGRRAAGGGPLGGAA